MKSPGTTPSDLIYVIDGGGSAIETGEKGHLRVTSRLKIKEVAMLADQTGSIVVDIWKSSYPNFPPADENSITASTPPTISSSYKSRDISLEGWTKDLAAGDILAFNVDSCTTITRVTINIRAEKG